MWHIQNLKQEWLLACVTLNKRSFESFTCLDPMTNLLSILCFDGNPFNKITTKHKKKLKQEWLLSCFLVVVAVFLKIFTGWAVKGSVSDGLTCLGQACLSLILHKSQTERGPERSCRINTKGSYTGLGIRNTSTTTKTRVAYGNYHQACV